MKRIFTFSVALALAVIAFGQHLVTGNSDVIGISGWPYSQSLIEAGPNSFYWVGGNYQGYSVEHPLLGEVYIDYSNVYFIKYDEKGKPLYANHIRGSYLVTDAFSFNGGFTVMGSASGDVEANGNTIPINKANRMEYLAKYNDMCQFEKIVPVWDLGPSQYPNSIVQMDKRNGTLYLAGIANVPYYLPGQGMIGEEWADYLYVLKYDRDLGLKGAFTAGLEQYGEYGYYDNLAIIPDARGGVVITGTYEGDRAPVIGGDTLTSMMMESHGLFAFKLDANFEKVWVQEGTLGGFDYYDMSLIYKGLAMPDGDIVLAGATSTGYFQLGDAKISFENGSNYTNQFAYRMAPDGTVKWTRPLQSMGEVMYDLNKKEVQSEQFADNINWDVIQWNDQVLYMTGTFRSDSFEVAGRRLEKPLYNGIYVAALDLATGAEQWGYALSSNYVNLHGFDCDAGGNVSVMGYTAYLKEMEVLGADSVPGTEPIFLLGLDYGGMPLWYNNAHLQGLGYGVYGADLEVLSGGEVFSAMYKSTPDPLLIGGTPITSQYDYTSLLAALEPDNALGGTVTDKSGGPVSGRVKAYKSTKPGSGAFPAVDSVMLDEAGGYQFEGLYPGTYALLAIPDADQYPEGAPTYYDGVLSWNDAELIPVEADTRYTFLNFILTEVPVLVAGGGTGAMYGNVSYDEEVGKKGTVGKPVTRTSVILVKKSAEKSTLAESVTAYVKTDDQGNYAFGFVPDGEYTLIVDIPGLPMIHSYDVTIVGNRFYGLNFIVKKEGVDTSGTVDVESVSLDRFMLFPNPGNGLIHIDFPIAGDYRITIFNHLGQLVGSSEYHSAAGLVRMDISRHEKGMYILKIEGTGGVETLKYVKE